MRRTLVIAAAALCGACGGMVRTPDQYRDDTARLLETQTTLIKTCYEAALKTDPKAKGTVTLRFTVARRSGKITRIEQDAARTTAPSSLAQCVINAIEPLELEPPGKQVGEAVFSWEFELAPAAPPVSEPPVASPAS